MPVLMRRPKDPAVRAEPGGSGPITPRTRYEDLPEFLRVPELAALWRVSPSTVYSLIKRGELRAHHMRQIVRIPREQVQTGRRTVSKQRATEKG
jgi:excisionase family DNA binding protein